MIYCFQKLNKRFGTIQIEEMSKLVKTSRKYNPLQKYTVTDNSPF